MTGEMAPYIDDLVARRKADPKEDLLTRLVQAEVDGERLTAREILGSFQILLVAGNETTTNLINNAILCLLEFSDQLDLLPGCAALPAASSDRAGRVLWLRREIRAGVEPAVGTAEGPPCSRPEFAAFANSP